MVILYRRLVSSSTENKKISIIIATIGLRSRVYFNLFDEVFSPRLKQFCSNSVDGNYFFLKFISIDSLSNIEQIRFHRPESEK